MAKKEKQTKPYPEFPLGWHSSGYWQKRIAGKMYYFGERWGSPEDALEDYLTRRDHPEGPKASQGPRNALTVESLCDYFLDAKEAQRKSGRLAQRSYNDYFRVSKMLVRELGKTRNVEAMTPEDFGRLQVRLTEGLSINTGANRIRIARIIFRFAEQDGLIEGRLKMGSQFKTPERKYIRLDRQRQKAEHGDRLFEPQQIMDLMAVGNDQWKAMLLLAINCGFGNTDLSEIQVNHFAGEWVEFPRQKTAVERIAWLWPETREALVTHGIGERAGRVFCRRTGAAWVKVSAKCVDDGIAKQFLKMMVKAGHQRKGLTFYSLRHTFQTIADGAKDPIATSVVMGHVDESMAGRYREMVDRQQIRAVCEHVRRWLFGAEVDAGRLPAKENPGKE